MPRARAVAILISLKIVAGDWTLELLSLPGLGANTVVQTGSNCRTADSSKQVRRKVPKLGLAVGKGLKNLDHSSIDQASSRNNYNGADFFPFEKRDKQQEAQNCIGDEMGDFVGKVKTTRDLRSIR